MKNQFAGLVIGIFIGMLVFSGIGVTAASNQIKPQVQDLGLDVYFNGDIVQFGKKNKFFYTSEKTYVPSTILYQNTVYVPLDYFSNMTGNVVYRDEKGIHVEAKNKSIEKPKEEIFFNHEGKMFVQYEDLKFFGIDVGINDDVRKVIRKLKSTPGLHVTQANNEYYISDSNYLDASYILAIKSHNNKIVGVSYEEFDVEEKNILNIATYRGIGIGSTIADLLGVFDTSPGVIEKPIDEDGNHTIMLVFDCQVDAEGGPKATMTFLTNLEKNQEIEEATIFGIEFKVKDEHNEWGEFAEYVN